MVRPNDIEAAQAAWAEGVVAIGAAETWEQAHALATAFVARVYAVEDEQLLFCPTKARETQFRPTLRDAVSYFVGRDAAHGEDGGFALEPWTAVRFENAGVVCRDGVGMAMGNYYFRRRDGTELEVEYSFVYVPGPDGRLLIQLHHSALPFSG